MLCPAFAFGQINTDRVMAIGRNALYFEDYVLSIQYFNQIINAKPYLSEPYFYRGLAKMNLDDFQGAEMDCSEALERNPFVISAYQVRGLSRIKQNNIKGAIEDYEKAIKLDPENIGVWHNLSLCRIEQKDYAKAKKDLDKLLEISPKYTKAYLMRGEVDLKQKDTISAEQDYAKAIEIDKYDPDVWASRAMLRLQQEKFKEAENDLDQAIYLSTRNSGLYINRALARYHQKNLRGAMSDYDFALDIEPNNFIGHYNRGLLRAQVGDDNRAIEDFNFVIKIEPDNMMAVFNRGLLLDQTGDYKGAIKDYSTVIKEYPAFMLGYQYRARARKKIGDMKGAQADELVLLKAQLDSQNGTHNNNLAKNKNTRKKSDKDMENYGKIVVADNEEGEEKYKSDYRGRVQDKKVTINPQAMIALNYYEKSDEVKRQVNYYKYIEELNSKKILPQRLLITNEEAPLTEDQVKRHFASINNISAELARDSENFNKRFARAIDFYLVQDYANSLEDLNEVIKKQPNFFLAYFMRAVIHYKQLEYRKMDKEYEAKDLTEEDKTVKAIDYESVKQDYDKVIELAPDFVFAYYNRANVCSMMKDYRNAISDYDKAIQLDSRFSDAYFNRGLTNIYLGNNRQGIQDLSKAGELGLFSAYNIIKRFTDRKQ